MILDKAEANDEPVFVVRAKDIFAPSVVQHYISCLRQFGPTNPDFLAEINDLLYAMNKWREAHIADVKYPD